MRKGHSVSRWKAAAIIAVVATILAQIVGTLTQLPVSLVMARMVDPDTLYSLEFVIVRFCVGLVVSFLSLLATFWLLIERFPFGRHRLRLVPKSEQTVEVFS